MFLSLLWIDFPNLSLKDSIFWKFVHVIKLEETNRNSFRLRIFELVKLLKKACRVRRMTGKPHSVNASKNIEFLYVTRMHMLVVFWLVWNGLSRRQPRSQGLFPKPRDRPWERGCPEGQSWRTQQKSQHLELIIVHADWSGVLMQVACDKTSLHT